MLRTQPLSFQDPAGIVRKVSLRKSWIGDEEDGLGREEKTEEETEQSKKPSWEQLAIKIKFVLMFYWWIPILLILHWGSMYEISFVTSNLKLFQSFLDIPKNQKQGASQQEGHGF